MGRDSATLVGALIAALLLSANAQAEMYVGGEIGAMLPNDFSSISGTGGFAGNTLSDLRLRGAIEYGARVGYFLPSVKWLGFEVQWFNASPHFKDQNVSVNGASAGNFPGSRLKLEILTFNLVGRVPLGRFEPYVGAGPGVFFAHADDTFGTGQNSRDTAPGLNAFAGVRFWVMETVAIFGEYKYDRARFAFDNFAGPPDGVGVKGTYSANTFSVGIAFNLSRLLHL